MNRHYWVIRLGMWLVWLTTISSVNYNANCCSHSAKEIYLFQYRYKVREALKKFKNQPRLLLRFRPVYVIRLFEIYLVTQSLFKRLLLMTGTNVLQVLTAYCNMLNILRPAKAPGFAYAWLEIVSHRVFIGRILSLTPQQKGTTPEILSV